MLLYVLIQKEKLRVNPIVHCGLWMIMRCQCRFINGNKCTTLVEDVDKGEGCAHAEAGGTWESSVPPSNFALNLKLL